MTEQTTSDLLRRAYAAFNARDADGGAALMADDVTWPNVADGSFVHGRDAVREHWREQFEAVDPRIELLAVDPGRDGSARASVRQVVRSKDGETISDERLDHVYTIHDGLIQRMELAK
jgi:uncharacterized protein (TIGR02246 family)